MGNIIIWGEIMKIDYVKLIVSVVICQLAGGIGSIFTVSSVGSWYSGLKKPFFNPPNWLFGPVWTLLFLLMGVSFYLLWVNHGKTAMIVFGVQLLLNVLWSVLFFGLKSPLYALIEIFMLWAAILAAIIVSYNVSKTASYLMVPYILWVSFAIMLNLMIYRMNA